MPPPGAAQVKIEAALNSPADMEFKDAHLTDVIDTLKDRYKIEVQFDRKAMDEAGIGSDATVTRVVKGTTLRRALRPMLHDLGLACVVEDEVLLVTTTEAAETKLNTVLYPVADLVTRRDEPGNPETDFDSLFNVIHSTVEPTTWDEVGGPGSIAKFSAGKAHLLIISQTQEVHEEIAALLAGLREAANRLTPGSKDAYRPIYRHKPTAAERKIIDALQAPTVLEFVNTPLADMLDYLKDYHQIEIQLDKKALEEAGIATDAQVTKNLKGISLRSGLRLMLRDLGLTYVIQDEVLLITTVEAAECKLTLRIYPVADLVLTDRGRQGGPVADFDSLTDVIRGTIQPTTWDEVGGPGNITPLDNALVLVVAQTQDVQEDVAALLTALRGQGGGRGRPGDARRHRRAPARPGRGEDRPRPWRDREDRLQRYALDRRDRLPERRPEDQSNWTEGPGQGGHHPTTR